jgi:hypothetical protein
VDASAGTRWVRAWAGVCWLVIIPLGWLTSRRKQLYRSLSAYEGSRRWLTYESESNFPTAISVGLSASESYCERYSQKALAKQTISNPVKFVYFVRGVSRHASVDDGLTESKLR